MVNVFSPFFNCWAQVILLNEIKLNTIFQVCSSCISCFFLCCQVIPLSQRSGLLEWCEGTVPFGEYLIGSRTGAHQRYRPQDLPASSCRAELAVSSFNYLFDLYQQDIHSYVTSLIYCIMLRVCTSERAP